MKTLDLTHLYQNNVIYRSLIDNKLVFPSNIQEIHHRTRDKEISVLQDSETKVIFLSEIPKKRYYAKNSESGDLVGNEHLSHTIDNGIVRSKKLEDEDRRFQHFFSSLEGKSICDFGTGHGLFLDLCVGVASEVCGIELRKECIKDINCRLGNKVSVKSSYENFSESFDVITMFHVLEHLEDQLRHLKDAFNALKSGGEIILEVPHAEDFLIEKLKLKAFYDFGFWSEHLILHTQITTGHYLQLAGFINIEILPFQRFGYANHLYWLRHGKPGGHQFYKDITNNTLDNAYRNFLCLKNWSDTLIARARRP